MKDAVAKRIVFLDYLRVFACFLVILAHCAEPFYYSVEGGKIICLLRNAYDANWLAVILSACMMSVPLFVVASSYLLFPVKMSMGDFLRRRFLRILIPFVAWSCIYCAFNGAGWREIPFNFPMCAAHLWFVPMLLGLYLMMPLLSPWAERASEKQVRCVLIAWLFTTLFPFIRKATAPFLNGIGGGSEPFLWGEALWNDFGAFYYVSGFIGYVLLGFYFRRFVPEWSWRRTLTVAVPLWLAGWAILGGIFLVRLPVEGGWPIKGPLSLAADLEFAWHTTNAPVAVTAIAAFLVIRKMTAEGAFYRHVIKPLAAASFGTYLVHMIVLTPVLGWFRVRFSTPLTIGLAAIVSFALSSLLSLFFSRLPKIGKYLG